MEGTIFNIQRYSIHDGPGIRTTVFFKGCNLRCFWCHNPESIKREPEVQVHKFKCINCLKCVEVCQAGARKIENDELVYTRDMCRYCGKCIDVCYAGAIEWVGKKMKVEEVIREIERDIPFYKRSGGGVTFSGGEPLIQKDFLRALLEECKNRGIHTAVDTAGSTTWKNFEEIINLVDLFLYDIKSLDEEKHKQVTGKSNKNILDNLKKLSDLNKRIFIRIPVVPGVNDSKDEMGKIADLLIKRRSVERIELLSFHQLGSGKYKNMDKKYTAENLKPLEKGKMVELADVFREKGLEIQIR